MALRFRDILLETINGECVAIVRIGEPKNRWAIGFGQFVTIRDRETVQWLTWLCRQARPELKLWASGRAKLISYFRAALDALNIPSSIFSLGGLRAGGATFLVMSDVEIAKVKYLGRWTSESSMGAYIQESMSLLVLAQLAPAVREELQAFVAEHAWALARPPALPWTRFFSRQRQWRSLTTSSSAPKTWSGWRVP